MLAKTVIAAALGFSLMVPASCPAQEIDLTQLKCTDFIKSNQQTVASIMFWLSGYYTYEEDPPIINTSSIAAKESQVRQYCADNPLLPLLEASEIFMDKKYNKPK